MKRLLKSKGFYLLIFSGIASIGYWYISTWDKSVLGNRALYPYPWDINSTLNEKYELLLHNKIKFGLCWGFVFLILQCFVIYFPLSLKRKKFIKNTLTHIINQYLKGNVSNNRITIYVCKRGFEIYLRYFWLFFIKNFLKHYRHNLILKYVFQFPKPFRKYLVFSGRTGRPFEDGTSTFFLVPDSEEEISGIAPFVFYERKPKFVELPDINKINIHKLKSIDEIKNEEDRDLVLDYMRNGKVNSFEKLKMFHRFPQHLFATPINNEKNEPFGVIVFDSLEKTVDFRDNLDNLLGYCKITENIINYIN